MKVQRLQRIAGQPFRGRLRRHGNRWDRSRLTGLWEITPSLSPSV